VRLLICAGGTGGGVYPALAVLAELTGENPPLGIEPRSPNSELQVLWVGGKGGMEEELVKQAGVPFEAIPAAGIHGVGWQALPGNLLQLARGFRQARRILRQFHPQAILFTGGYVAGPMALASRMPGSLAARSRNVLYVPDIEPGLALKTLARFADCIVVTDEASRAFFTARRKVVVSGYPVRRGLRSWERDAARKALGLEPDLPVLLVTGGSKGARSINRALVAAMPGLLPATQILHISGSLDWPAVEAARAELLAGPQAPLAGRYHAHPYLHELMGAALAASDLVVARAGASTLGEFPMFGLPAVLVPYPYAWRYQQVNAAYLAKRGAALVVEDANLPASLDAVVKELLNRPARLEAMGAAMRSLARPQAARVIAGQLFPQAERGDA